MSDTRPVPTNLDSWPGVIDLVVTYKHLLHVLWSSPSGLMSIIGVGRAGIIEHLTGATRLDESVVLEALRELHRRGLVAMDEETREVAVRRWCRFHTFSGKWEGQAKVAYSKIESATIKGILAKQEGVNSLFPEKSSPQPPNTTTTLSSTTTTTATTSSSSAEIKSVVVTDLIFPTNTPQVERNAIQTILASSGVSKSDWQAILDELTGARLHRTIGNPVGFLRGIVERALSGTFARERGIAVAQKRMAEEKRAQEVADTSKRSNEILPIDVVLERLPASTSAFLSRKMGEANLT